MRLDTIRSTLALCGATLALSLANVAGSTASAQQREATAGDSARAKPKPDLGPMHRIEFDTDEGSWTNVDVSPDGRTILFDLLGDLYTLPIAGGDAKLLIGGRDWDQMPRYSPDGKRIAFISDRDGNMNLWIADADGTHPKQLSREQTSAMSSPVWSADGSILVRKATRTGIELWSYYADGGAGYKLPVSGQIAGPAISHDGRYLFLSGLRRIDRATGDTILLGQGFRPKVSPDGRWLAYARPNDQFTALHIRDIRSGADRRLVAAITPEAAGFTNQDQLPDYAFTPDGKSIVLTIAGKIHRVDVATGQTTIIPMRVHVAQDLAQPIHIQRRIASGELRARVLRWPSIAPDGRRVVVSALGKLYSAPLPDAQHVVALAGGPSQAGSDSTPPAPVVSGKRVTGSDDREYTPAYSPDGKWIAYTTWNDTSLGYVMIIPASCAASAGSCTPRKATTIAGRYSNPVWSRDGLKLAFVRGGGVEQRGGQPESETYFDVMWVSAEGGEPQHVTSTYASRAIGFPMRYYPVIAFDPSGTRLFYSQWARGSTPGSASQSTLYSVRLDGTDRRAHMRFIALDEVVPSPDGRHVAFVRKNQVMVAALPQFPTAPVDLNFDNPSIPLKKLARQGGNYVSWLDSSTVSWIFLDRLYRQSIDSAGATPIAQVSIAAPRDEPKGMIAFTNARIVTMRGDEVIQRGTILVDGNHIASVGANGSVAIPSGARRVDLSGKTIMPGIVDVHAHMHYQAFEAFPQRKWEYIANLAYGVTSTFDPSAHNLDVFSQQEMVETGEMLGPRIFSSGDVIYGDESVFPEVYESIKSIDDARAIVKRYVPYGPEMLKEYMQPRRDQRQWLAQAAREAGVEITAEGGGDLVLDLTMLLDGYTAWEHALPIAPLYNDVIQLVAKSGVNYTPTLIVGYGGPTLEQYFATKNKIHDDVKLRRFTPEDALEHWRKGWTYVPDEEWHFIDVSKSAAKMTHAGAFVTLGAHGNRQGLGAQWELWGMQMGGLTNMEAIREATILPAKKIGYDQDIGSIEKGKLADFLVMDANPLDDIHNTATIRYTVKNGIVFDAASMTELWPQRKPLARFFWQTEEDTKRFAAPAPAGFK